MKKLYSIVCAGLTVMSAMSVSAQTLTQDWKYTSDLPTIGDARYATAHDGVVYVSDKMLKSFMPMTEQVALKHVQLPE